MPFTDAKIRSLRAKKERYPLYEDGKTGLVCRVSPNGKKTFAYSYRIKNENRKSLPRMLTLGTYPKLTLHSARVLLAKAKETLSKGIDPATLQIEHKNTEKNAETVKDLCAEYIERWAKPHKRSWKEDQRILSYDIIPRWGERKAKSISRRDVIKLLDEIADRGAPIQANRTLEVVRKMYNFALGRDIVSTSPCGAIPRPTKENKSERVLDENEIRAFWHGLAMTPVSEGIKLTLRFQLLTAQRKGEVRLIEWTEINWDTKIWTIPSEKAKNGVAHYVPLSPSAMKLLHRAKDLSGLSKWVFPSPRKRKKALEVDVPLGESSINHAISNNFDVFGIEPFSPHTLRKTASTLMASLGVERFFIERILNHVDSSVTGRYDLYAYHKEKRQALEKLGRKLDEIITGKKAGKVIELKR